ncbi:hypothetical protein KQI63_07130 [bacterium]|nr:hypothetical protein [bacterium]
MALIMKRWVLTAILFCLGPLMAQAFPPSYDFSRLPEDETGQFSLRYPAEDKSAGTLYESLHLEDRYGLSVYVLTRRFEGDLFELETIEFEAESFIPIRATRVQKVRGMNVETEIQFQSTRAVITVREPELLGGKTSTTMIDIPRESITLQQVPYALRTKPLRRGESYRFTVLPMFGPTRDTEVLVAVVEHGISESGTPSEAVLQCSLGSERWQVRIGLTGKRPLLESGRSFSGSNGLAGLALHDAEHSGDKGR